MAYILLGVVLGSVNANSLVDEEETSIAVNLTEKQRFQQMLSKLHTFLSAVQENGQNGISTISFNND